MPRSLTRLSQSTLDRLFLAAVLFLSFVAYVGRLGFYYDDYSDLGFMHTAADQSLGGFMRALLEFDQNTRNRPVQVLYEASLYRLYGDTAPLYHVTNALVFSVGILLFLIALQALHVPRILALALPLTYGLLPNFSTDRFWYVAFVANLAMALYFLALWSEVRALEDKRSWLWHVSSVVALVTASLAYEVFLPLFLANPAIVWWIGRSRGDRARRFPWMTTFVAAGVGAGLVAFKLLTSTRLDANVGLTQHVRLTVWLMREALTTNFLVHGFGLPLLGWKAVRAFPDPSTVALAGVTGTGVFLYLNHVGRERSFDEIRRPAWTLPCLAVAGVLVCLAGYAVFLFNYQVSPNSPTGIGNRTAIAAAVGVAMTLVAVAAGVSALWPWGGARRLSFSFLIATLCCGGVAVNNTLASLWVEAAREGREIMASLHAQLPAPLPDSTIVLDGMCTHRGPAIVFLQDWDSTGALMQLYGRRDIKGDVVLSYTKVRDDVLSVSHEYPYSKLLIYNHKQRKVFAIVSADAARRYFADFDPDYTNGCPRFGWSNGVAVF